MTALTTGYSVTDDEPPPSPMCRREAPFQLLARGGVIRIGTGASIGVLDDTT